MTGLRLRGGAACFLLRDCLAVLLTTHCPLVATAQHSPDIAQNNQGELPGAGRPGYACARAETLYEQSYISYIQHIMMICNSLQDLSLELLVCTYAG